MDCTSAVNVATRTRGVGDTVDCNLVHSINSFSFNALMSCSTESSRTESRVMVISQPWSARHSFCVASQGHVPTQVVDHNLVTWLSQPLPVLSIPCSYAYGLGKSVKIFVSLPDHVQVTSAGTNPVAPIHDHQHLVHVPQARQQRGRSGDSRENRR